MLYRLCGPFTAVRWRHKKPFSVSRHSLTAFKATQSALQPVNALQHQVVSPRYIPARTLHLDIASNVSQLELVEFPDCPHISMPCSEDTSVKLLNEHIGKQRLQLRQQHIALDGHDLCLIEPADVDAVIDMYIAAGKTPSPAEIRLSILSHAGNGPGPHKQRSLHQPESWLKRGAERRSGGKGSLLGQAVAISSGAWPLHLGTSPVCTG